MACLSVQVRKDEQIPHSDHFRRWKKCYMSTKFTNIIYGYILLLAIFGFYELSLIHLLPTSQLHQRLVTSAQELLQQNAACEKRKEWITGWQIEEAKTKPTSLLHVFQSPPQEAGVSSNRAMIASLNDPVNGFEIEFVQANTPEEQRIFIEAHGKDCYRGSIVSDDSENPVLERFDSLLSEAYRSELWKYCALSIFGGIYVDPDCPLLGRLEDALPLFNGSSSSLLGGMNYAVLGYGAKSIIHGSMIAVSAPMSRVTLGIVELLVEKSNVQLHKVPFLVSEKLYELITDDLDVSTSVLPLNPGLNRRNKDDDTNSDVLGWTLFEEQCDLWSRSGNKALSAVSEVSIEKQLRNECPSNHKYCCVVKDTCASLPILVSTRVVQPFLLPPSFPSTYSQNAKKDTTSTPNQEVSPFITTIREENFNRPANYDPTPNFSLILNQSRKIPNRQCITCLQRPQLEPPFKGGTCYNCSHILNCDDYCKMLCNERPKEKFVSKRWLASSPSLAKDSSRLIPQIIHQSQAQNPSTSRNPNVLWFLESWKRSGYEYRFYDDNAVKEFFETHYPPEVREAYDSLLSPAFKSDLFRYCVLFIHGGIYVDTNIMLESNLDVVIPPHAGFMISLDAIGESFGKKSCLWNGFIASAPGHPFLASAIQQTVNRIRNRFLIFDVDNELCPTPLSDSQYIVDTRLTHGYSYMHMTGSCILGATVNKLLGRTSQQTFPLGVLDTKNKFSLKIPGITVILAKNSDDMGSTRITWNENNIIIAATDVPEFGQEGEDITSSFVRGSIFGLDGFYASTDFADEDINIVVDA